ncbi:hypothetical protein GIX45_25135 [Erwinia sp. CPCC 100877]|nr:hypothetical protein [Erwinia sp. CPCC 100877]
MKSQSIHPALQILIFLAAAGSSNLKLKSKEYCYAAAFGGIHNKKTLHKLGCETL